MIVIVDDDAELREELAETLRCAGHSTQEFEHGAAALAWLERAAVQPSLILLDLMMPVMDGWEFRSRQRRSARLSGIPVVVMSGAGDVKTEARVLGAAGFLLKPFRHALLFEVVAQFDAGPHLPASDLTMPMASSEARTAASPPAEES